MDPREHHHFFAKRMIPTHTFQSTDKMFAELTGPKREAFLMWLWNEAGSTVHPKLPHVAVENGQLAKLEVVGAIKSGDQEVVVLSMPPAIHPNEAAFIALARKPGMVRVFFLERCRDEAGTGVHPSEAVLSELRSDDSRVNHGFAPGLDLAAFKQRVGAALGVSLEGIERSLPEITMAAFTGAGGGGASAKGKPVGSGPFLAGALLVRAGLPLLFMLLARIMPGVLLPIWRYVDILYSLLALVIGITLIVWVYQVHAARRQQASLSPGGALAFMLLPGFNLFLMPFALRSAWKATVGAGGGLLVLGWWLLWLGEIVRNVLTGPQMSISRVEGGDWGFYLNGNSLGVPGAVGEVFMIVVRYGAYLQILAWGLLWYIVKRVNERT